MIIFNSKKEKSEFDIDGTKFVFAPCDSTELRTHVRGGGDVFGFLADKCESASPLQNEDGAEITWDSLDSDEKNAVMRCLLMDDETSEKANAFAVAYMQGKKKVCLSGSH